MLSIFKHVFVEGRSILNAVLIPNEATDSRQKNNIARVFVSLTYGRLMIMLIRF